MQQIAIKLLLKLMTETFMSKMIVLGARELGKSTKFTDFDDKAAEALAEALGVK